MLELTLWVILAIVALAFMCEYMDSTLGMGYGTTLTPVLLLFGWSPVKIVTAVLFSELITGLLASFFHHREGNVNLKPSTMDVFKIHKLLSPLGYVDNFKKTVPLHMKTALLLAVCSIVGTVAAVLIAVNIPKFWLKLYIGVLVLSMGIVILFCINKKFKFSWSKMMSLGMIASFNKGMSGGGYGPVVTGGQILAGVQGRSAVGVTSLAEGLTCLVGVIMYFFFANTNSFDWKLTSWICLGAVLSVPLSAKSVKIMTEKKLKILIALLTIILGSWTIINTLRS